MEACFPCLQSLLPQTCLLLKDQLSVGTLVCIAVRYNCCLWANSLLRSQECKPLNSREGQFLKREADCGVSLGLWRVNKFCSPALSFISCKIYYGGLSSGVTLKKNMVSDLFICAKTLVDLYINYRIWGLEKTCLKIMVFLSI